MFLLSGDGLFHIIFGIIFFVIYLCLALVILVQTILYLIRKNKFKAEASVILLLFVLYNIIPVIFRVVYEACNMSTTNAANSFGLKLFIVIIVVPLRTITISTLLFFAIVFATIVHQCSRICTTFRQFVYVGRCFQVAVIVTTCIFGCIIIALSIVVFIDGISLFASIPTTNWNNISTATQTSSSTFYISCAVLLFYCFLYIGFTIVMMIFLGSQANRLKSIFLQIHQRALQVYELQSTSGSLELDYFLTKKEEEDFLQGMSILEHSKEDLEAKFTVIYRLLWKVSMGVIAMLIVGIIHAVVFCLLGLGASTWLHLPKLTHIMLRLDVICMIPIVIFTKDWMYKLNVQFLKLITQIQTFKPQQIVVEEAALQ